MNAPNFIQAERILRVETPLGEDQLLAEKLTLREAVNELFTAELAVRSKIRDIAPDELLGKLIDFSVELGGGQRRSWNALVTGMNAGPKGTRDKQSYALILRPEAWLLTQKSDCRIWLDKTSLEVAETLFSEHGIVAPDTSGVVAAPPPLHYSVQYNETDWAYLVRRLEEDGLFYWFVHEVGQHVMRISDHPSGYTTGDDPDLRYAAGSTDRNHINRFETRFRYTPGVHASADWNFETPGQVPGGSAPSIVSLPRNGDYERFEYPAVYGYGHGTRASEEIADEAVARVAQLRMQADEALHCRVDAASTVRTLAPGQRFTPFDVANPDNVYGEYITLAIEHAVVDTSYEAVADNEPEYTNRFIALPAALAATPHRSVPHPRIDGAQVAIVAGPEGEEIHPDEYGRIKVWFPWDRRAAKDGSDTCWIRVMQNWAGSTWGGQVIPRIGMEVMVNYLEGDPDRPVVTGVVPNARQTVPYDLPSNKTKSVFRSNTHKGSGFNEITFEDENGRENQFFHAQKDQTTRVLNDRTKRVDRHEVAAIGANRVVEVGNNQKTEVGGSMNTVVGGTGTSALALMAAVQPLIGNTAFLLDKAGELAGSDSPGLGVFSGTVASAALGFHGAMGMFNRQGVVGGASNRPDAGRALADAGSGVGDGASGLFPMPGVMNTIVGSFRSDTVGVARAEQVGMSKVTNVGATQMINVGREQRTTVGRKIDVEVGELYRLVAGETFYGESKVWQIYSDDSILLSTPGGYIELNKTGIRLRAKRIDIEGNAINFSRGGPGEGANCLREMAAAATPFVRA